jgi:hypothetical protein
MSSNDNVSQDSQSNMSAKTSSISSVICEPAEKALFWAEKYRNYINFMGVIAEYIPEAQSWATSLRYMPLVAFQMQLSTYFHDAIDAHNKGDKTARDAAACLVVRQQARANDFELTKLRSDHYIRLLRYTSLFVILTAED